MGDGGTVFDHQNTPAPHGFGVVGFHRRGAADNGGAGIDATNGLGNPLYVSARCGIGFRDDNDIGHAQNGFPRIIRSFVTRP